ncbi:MULTISPECIES: hypothetical protein [unclassified Thalassotalea]|uniref:hypothetical protein n=1 Tax=unclassified Thalassotalea TaxID=2614972 RepID=UPI0010818D73|nr:MULTISPECIES: hypothetical protein [unclassified Thalassotalea]NMP17172.1 hypothetical protein [Thalassotalea sp. Y01]QBY03897.1 hypothetical protein E2K93_05655 [Thalassotalea sp. HSM 43]
MNKSIEKHLIENISQLLKRSLKVDATLTELRADKQANFQSIFPQNGDFTVKADTFQPYIEEIANELLVWQQTQNNELLATMVKKIELLYSLIGKFESLYQQQ